MQRMGSYCLNLCKIQLKRYLLIFVSLSILFGIYHQQSLLANVGNDGHREFLLNESDRTTKSSISSTTPSYLHHRSTCSLAADRRGAHQKVIGYSIYGDFSNDHVYRKYLKPFTDTLRSIPIRYPGKTSAK